VALATIFTCMYLGCHPSFATITSSGVVALVPDDL
jgi:hypothetical protein